MLHFLPQLSPNVYRTIASLHPTQRTHTHWAKSNAYQPHTCIFIQFLCIFGTPADKWITKSGRKDESTQGGGECVCVSWWESEKEIKRREVNPGNLARSSLICRCVHTKEIRRAALTCIHTWTHAHYEPCSSFLFNSAASVSFVSHCPEEVWEEGVSMVIENWEIITITYLISSVNRVCLHSSTPLQMLGVFFINVFFCGVFLNVSNGCTTNWVSCRRSSVNQYYRFFLAFLVVLG